MSRVRHAEPVLLNVYDLHPANDWVYPLGLGAYHSGIEVFGEEWTFASGAFERQFLQYPSFSCSLFGWCDCWQVRESFRRLRG